VGREREREKENIRIEIGLFLTVSGVLTQLESPGADVIKPFSLSLLSKYKII
jgi:hypothetical protein